MIKQFSTLALITSLAACGGSSGDGNNTANKVTGDLSVSFDAYKDDTITGKLTTNSTFTPQNNVAGEFGRFSIEANGQWAYKPNTFDYQQVKLLNADSIEDKFTVTTSNGEQQQVTVSAPIKYQRLAYAKKVEAPISTTIYDPETDRDLHIRDISVFLDADLVAQASSNSLRHLDYEYESDNNLTNETYYNRDNEIEYQTEYNYIKENGQVTTIESQNKIYSMIGSDFLYLRHENNYRYVWDNLNGRYVSSSRDYTRTDQYGELLLQTNRTKRFEYNNAGNPSKEFTTYLGESEYLNAEYTYNENNRLNKSNLYSSDGSLNLEYLFFYDEFNRSQAYVRKDVSRPELDRIYFQIYHPELHAVVIFSVLKDEFIKGQITSSAEANVYFYDDTATCGDIDKAQAKLAHFPISNCRIKTELPATSDLPSLSDLGY